jgi:hypothetical protein
MALPTEDYDEDYDDLYTEDWDEDWDEARRRGRPSRVRTARPSAPPARPPDRSVTQAQFQMAINRINADTTRNSAAIQRVNSNLSGLNQDIRRQGKAVRDSRKDVAQLKEFVLLFPLLQEAIGDENGQLAAILPFLLLGGGYGGSGSDGGGGLFGGSNLLILVLLLGGLGNRSGKSHSGQAAIASGTARGAAKS